MKAVQQNPDALNHRRGGSVHQSLVCGTLRTGDSTPDSETLDLLSHICTMKASRKFREQVDRVSSWFRDWTECEQTVALYSLLKRLTPPQAKFLDQVLQQMECTSQANDQAFIASLRWVEDKGQAILKLLQMLPFLQTGNERAKQEYLTLISALLSHTIDQGTSIEESRQLLSCSLTHPAMGHSERTKLRLWLGYLDQRFTYSITYSRNRYPAPASASAPSSPPSLSPFLPSPAALPPSSQGGGGYSRLLGGPITSTASAAAAAASTGPSATNSWLRHHIHSSASQFPPRRQRPGGRKGGEAGGLGGTGLRVCGGPAVREGGGLSVASACRTSPLLPLTWLATVM